MAQHKTDWTTELPSLLLIMQVATSEKTLNRTDTWPNASTSYHEYRASRCNGCAAAAADSLRTTVGQGADSVRTTVGQGEEDDDELRVGGIGGEVGVIIDGVDGPDQVMSRLQEDGPIMHQPRNTIGGSQPINLDVLRSTPHHTCAGHYATADAQFKVGHFDLFHSIYFRSGWCSLEIYMSESLIYNYY